MNAIYKLIGDDGKEYGPATAEQIKRWIGEKRVERQTPVFVDGAKDWNFVGLLPEFASLFPDNPAAIKPQFSGTIGEAKKTNPFATAGLICGIASMVFICCGGIPFNILGVVFSIIALSRISNRPKFYTGRGIAIAGLIFSVISILFLLFALASGQFHNSFKIYHFD
jgi:hypothetical protein